MERQNYVHHDELFTNQPAHNGDESDLELPLNAPWESRRHGFRTFSQDRPGSSARGSMDEVGGRDGRLV